MFSFILIAHFSAIYAAGQQLTSAIPPNGALPVQASSADAFVDSIGVATHWAYPSYSTNSRSLQAMLIASGIRHIRDDANPTVMSALQSHGIKQTVLIDAVHGFIPNSTYWSGVPANATYTIANYLKYSMPAGSVDALEMPNELDVFYSGIKWHPTDTVSLSADPTSANYYGAYGAAVTKDCWQAIKSDPALASIKIIGPTVGIVVPSPYAAGSLFNFVDQGGFHPYPGRANSWTYPLPYDTIAKYYWNSFEPSVNIGSDPYGGNPLMFTWYQPPFASGSNSKPMVATETGYSTAASAQGTVSISAQAKYLPRLFAEYFRNGIARAFTYELYDEGTDPRNSEQNFGLIYNNLSPKPAFVALSNLISTLSEPGASFTPGTLSYSLAVQPSGAYTRTAYVHDLLLQKSNGVFYLLLWHEVSDSSNTDLNGNLLPGIQRDIAPPALTTTVTLPSSIAGAAILSYNSAWAFQMSSMVIANGQVTVPVGDTITILQLWPATQH